jgi:hypothetical protein
LISHSSYQFGHRSFHVNWNKTDCSFNLTITNFHDFYFTSRYP